VDVGKTEENGPIAKLPTGFTVELRQDAFDHSQLGTERIRRVSAIVAPRVQ
jgi:hypothetical protein